MFFKLKCNTSVISFQILSSLIWITWCLFFLSWLPTVNAQKPSIPRSFPNPTFQAFSNFILSNFHSEISLTTTLLILFSLIENPELLNLHARQTHPAYSDENLTQASGWMKTLTRGLAERLDYDLSQVLIQYTQWYNWRTGFQKILSNYPDMRAWLEETDNKKIEKDALEVWGVQKARYSLADLTEWVEHGGAFLEDEKEKKEKEKEKTRKKKKASGLSR